MSFLKRFSFALAFCFAISVPSWAQQAPVVYVATGDSNVYAVTTPGGAATQLIPSSNTSYSGAQFTSLTVGPDNTSDYDTGNYFFLYACDTAGNEIVRLRLSTDPPGPSSDVVTIYNGGGTLTQPVCGRVDSNGDLYVSTGTGASDPGVYVIAGASGDSPGTPVSVSSTGGPFTGGGITQKNFGDLLVVNTADSSVLSAGSSPFSSTLSNYIPNSPNPLDTPVGIARAEAPETGDAQTIIGDLYVANQGSLDNVLKFDPTALSNPTTCASYSGTNQAPTSIAASEDNFLYVGLTNSNPNSGNKNNWEINIRNASTCEDAGTISLSSLAAPLAVAVPPVEESPFPSVPETDPSTLVTTSTFNFGSSIVKTLTDNCAISVTQEQMPISYLNSLIPSPDTSTSWPGGVAIPYNGESGFGTLYTVGPSTCQPTDTDNNFVLAAFIDATQFANPRLIKCDVDPMTGTLGCTAPETTGFWPEAGLLPKDYFGGQGVRGFSKFFLANADFSSPATGTFCGFESPLPFSSTLEDPAIVSTNNLSVKFKLASGSDIANCSNGPYITDATALLSIEKVKDSTGASVADPISITTQGNSTSNPPIFKYNKNKTSQNYQFSLSLKNYEPGVYALTVTFLSGNPLALQPNKQPYVTTYIQIP